MKILLTDNDTFFEQNGDLYVFKTTGEFALELQNIGHDVEMFQTKQSAKSDFHTFNVSKSGLRYTALRRYRSKIFTYIMVYIVGIWKVLRSDMVYIYFPSNYKYLGIIAKLFGKKYGMNVRGEKGVESRLSKFLYRHADVIFTVSPRFTEIVNRAGGRGITQRPAISFDLGDLVTDRKYEAKSCFKILFLGRIDRDKGVFELVEAVSRLKAEFGTTKFRLRVVGDGRELFEMKELARELEVFDMIEFCGAVLDINKIRQFYCESDIYVLPTYHEGFPRTLYEAMLFGTPIVTTFVGAIPTLMADGVNCYRIEPHSDKSISDKLKFVMNNYEQTAQLVENGRILVRELFDPSRLTHAQELDRIIRE